MVLRNITEFFASKLKPSEALIAAICIAPEERDEVQKQLKNIEEKKFDALLIENTRKAKERKSADMLRNMTSRRQYENTRRSIPVSNEMYPP